MPTQIELVKDLSADSYNWHEKYPWFSLGQLLNVSNKKQNNDFQVVAQSTAIFFNDVQRLHWLLHEQAFNKNRILGELNVPISTEGMQTTPQPFPKREHPQIIIAPNNLISIADVEENDAMPIAATGIKEKNILIGDVVIHQTIENAGEKEATLPDTIIQSEDLAVVDENEELLKSSNVYVQQPEETEKDIQVTARVAQKINVAETNGIVFSNNTEEIQEVVEANENADTKVDALNADSLGSINKAQENIKSVLNGGDATNIIFEPYHTIDYFASQGIKVDAKADDKLGKQLKSFTSWLKSMKRLPITDEATLDAPNVQIHDKSLDNTNVITEAMAAVLVKQGKKEQAIEIFRQLSLLHPEKSRYFAAQIEQIKN